MREKAPSGSLALPFDQQAAATRPVEQAAATRPVEMIAAAQAAATRPVENVAAPVQPRPVEELPLSISELLGYLSDTLRTEYADVLVVGELTSFKRHASGHCYFTL